MTVQTLRELLTPPAGLHLAQAAEDLAGAVQHERPGEFSARDYARLSVDIHHFLAGALEGFEVPADPVAAREERWAL